MARNSRLDDEAATELHNRLANQIVAQIVNEPIAAGDAKVLDLVVGRAGQRASRQSSTGRPRTQRQWVNSHSSKISTGPAR
jgi:hypothetical protein